jgi:hypothetical protein
MSTLIVPGRGVVNLAAAAIDRAVREYDERLLFATNPQTGQDTVFIKLPRDFEFLDDVGVSIAGDKVMPVLAFNPHQPLPHPDAVVRELYKRDTVRHGTKLLDDLHRHNEAIRKQYRAAAAEADEALAEAQESYLVHNGQTNYFRSLRPDPKRTAVKKG